MKTITVQLLLRFASLRQTGNDLREDPNTWLRATESELRPLNIGTVTRGRKQPLENTGVRLWTGLRSRRVGLCHAERVGDAWHTTGGACEVTGRTEN